MALNVLEAFQSVRKTSEEMRERARRAAEWYIEHKLVLGEQDVSYMEASERFEVGEWLIKQTVQRYKTRARIQQEQAREDTGE